MKNNYLFIKSKKSIFVRMFKLGCLSATEVVVFTVLTI